MRTGLPSRRPEPGLDASGRDQRPRRWQRPATDPVRLFGDDPEQLGELVPAVVAPPVEEEGGRSIHAADDATPELVPDRRRPSVGVELVPEPVERHPGGAGVLLEVGAGEAVLVLEEAIVHLPEPALRAGRLGGLGGELGVGMRVGERKVPERDPDQVARQALELLENRVRPPAVGTFEVPILDQRHRSASVAPAVVGLVDRPGKTRLLFRSHETPAGESASNARRMPSAPGFTPTGERWLQRTMPPPSITYSARSVVPSSSR